MIKPLFQHVLVAYNGSKSSLHAVMYSVMMAKVYGCTVKVVYVVDTETIRELTLTKFMVNEEGENVRKGLESDGERDLAYVSRLAGTKGIKIQTELRHGAVWSQIISAADDFKADLILLGGTCENPSAAASLNRDMIGSQDGEIIGSAHCSVLVVRKPYIEQLFKIC